MVERLTDCMTKYFGFSSFRTGQKEAASSALHGRDVDHPRVLERIEPDVICNLPVTSPCHASRDENLPGLLLSSAHGSKVTRIFIAGRRERPGIEAI